MPDSYWIEMRNHYSILSEWIELIDERFSLIILLSCSSNMYFVCAQLYFSFELVHVSVRKRPNIFQL